LAYSVCSRARSGWYRNQPTNGAEYSCSGSEEKFPSSSSSSSFSFSSSSSPLSRRSGPSHSSRGLIISSSNGVEEEGETRRNSGFSSPFARRLRSRSFAFGIKVLLVLVPSLSLALSLFRSLGHSCTLFFLSSGYFSLSLSLSFL